jgi:hypothetical protein
MVFTVLEVIDGACEWQRLKQTPVFSPPVKSPPVFQDVLESLTEGFGNLLLRRGYGQVRRNFIRL